MSSIGSFEINKAYYKFTNLEVLDYLGNITEPLEPIEDMKLDGRFDFYRNHNFDVMHDQEIVNLQYELSLDEIIDRTKNSGIWFNQLSNPNNRLESAIFGFYHLFLREGQGEDSLLKVLYSALILEGLYNVSSESIGNTLLKRINIMLPDFIAQTKNLKKIFNLFYSFRSKIIHGDYSMNNPIEFEDWHNPHSIVKIWDELDKSIYVIYAVIYASFQEIISKGLYVIEFEEILKE